MSERDARLAKLVGRLRDDQFVSVDCGTLRKLLAEPDSSNAAPDAKEKQISLTAEQVDDMIWQTCDRDGDEIDSDGIINNERLARRINDWFRGEMSKVRLINGKQYPDVIRCSHGVWLADHCYECAAQREASAAPAKQTPAAPLSPFAATVELSDSSEDLLFNVGKIRPVGITVGDSVIVYVAERPPS
jgi:hypothetical protein